MRIRQLLALVTMFLSFAAYAEFKTITLAQEIALNNFVVPASENGIVSFRTCDECDQQILSVTSQTSYRLNNESLTLQEFREEIFQVHQREDVTVIVHHHLETDTVPLISVAL